MLRESPDSIKAFPARQTFGEDGWEGESSGTSSSHGERRVTKSRSDASESQGLTTTSIGDEELRRPVSGWPWATLNGTIGR
jgi:hypothetical protein